MSEEEIRLLEMFARTERISAARVFDMLASEVRRLQAQLAASPAGREGSSRVTPDGTLRRAG